MTLLRNTKIDWINHLIGFLSALFGIFIAFRLESYRDHRLERERIEIAKQSLKQEIETNLKIYKVNVDNLSGWLEYKNFFDARLNEKHELVAGTNEIMLMSKKYPNRFADLKLIRSIHDTLKVYELVFMIDVVPTTGISTSNWKAAIASGVLNSMNYELTNNLAQMYDWIEKDIGPSEGELYENMLGSKFVNTDKINEQYYFLTNVYSYKWEKLSELYAAIDWEK